MGQCFHLNEENSIPILVNSSNGRVKGNLILHDP